MKIKTTLLSALLAVPCFGQTTAIKPDDKALLKEIKHPVHACLWEVTGKDLKKPSYLFGTCHVSDPRITTLHPNAKKAFEASDAVYGELKLEPADVAKIGKLMIRKDGKTVTEDLGEKRAARVDKTLKKINPAMSLKAGLDSLHTWAAGMTIVTLEEQLKGGKALDQQLLDQAKEAGKPTAGLETIESQMACFQAMKPEHQLLMIDGVLDFMEKNEGKNPMDEIKEIYILKTPKEIGVYLKDQMTHMPDGSEPTAEEKKMNEWFVSEFLDKRNIKMADKIDGLLEEKSGHSHFFAIGAGHYTGETAIQDLLKKKGYTITPRF